MLKLTTTEAREVLSDLVSRAAFGHERFILTRHGKDLAVLISIEDLEMLRSLEKAGPPKAPGRQKPVEDKDGVVKKGRLALKAMQAGAVARNADKLSDEEIDEEIQATRKARRSR